MANSEAVNELIGRLEQMEMNFKGSEAAYERKKEEAKNLAEQVTYYHSNLDRAVKANEDLKKELAKAKEKLGILEWTMRGTRLLLDVGLKATDK